MLFGAKACNLDINKSMDKILDKVIRGPNWQAFLHKWDKKSLCFSKTFTRLR